MNNWNYAGAGFWSIFFIIGIETGVAFNYFDEPNNISAGTGVRSFNERCSELLLDFFTEYYSTLLEDRSIDHTLKVNNSSGNNSSRNNSTRTESNPANRARELMSELLLSLDPPLASIALQYLDRNDSKMAEKEHNLNWIVHEAVAKILSDRSARTARRTLDEVLRTKRETHLVWGYLLDVLEEAAAELQRSIDAELNQELLTSLEQRFKRQTGSSALNTTSRITTPEPNSLLQRLEPIPQRLQQILLSQGFDARSSIADMVSFVVQIFQSFADRLRSEIPAVGISRLHGDNKLFDRLLPNLAVLAASPRQNARNTPQTSVNDVQRLISKGKSDELSAVWDAILNSNDSRVLKRVKRVSTPQKTGENSVVPPSVKTNMIDDTKVAKNISRRQIPLVYKPVPIISTITVTSAPSRSVSETPVEKPQVDTNQSRGSRVDVLEVQGKPMGNVTVTSSPQGSVSSNQTAKPVVETSVPKARSDPVRVSAATIPNDLIRKTDNNQASAGLPGSTLGTPKDVQGGSVSGANTSVSDSPKISTTPALTNPPAKFELPQQTSSTVLAKVEPSNAAKSPVPNHSVEPSNTPALTITKPEINSPPKSQVATNAVSDPVKASVPVSQLPVINPPAKPVLIPAIPPTNISTQPAITSSNELPKSVALLNTSVQPVSISDPMNDSAKAANSSAVKSTVNPSSTDAAVMKSPTETQNTGTGNQTAGTGNQTAGTGNQAAGTGNQTVGTGNQTAGTGNQTSGTQPSSIGASSQTVPPSIAIQYLNSGVSSETKTLPGVVVSNVPPVSGNGSSTIVNVSTLALTNVTGFMKEIPDQAAELTQRSKFSDANILEHSDYFNRDSIKLAGDIRTGGIQQYAGFVVVLVVLSLIVIGSVLFWKFSTETGGSGGENTTTRENLNSMNNYCYLTNNSNNCARTTGRTPDRVNLDDERSARSQLIELTQLRKSEVSA